MHSTSDLAGPPLTITTATATDLSTVVEPLFREYGEWLVGHLERDFGMTLTEADQDRYHDAFRAEFPRLLGSRGRLLVARLGDDPVGVGTLKPIDDTTAEIKRMYVRPAAQGRGIGRAILTRLVRDAGAEGYTTVRLETLRFMTTAQSMYRAFEFVETAKFDGAETANTEFEPLTISMELNLAGHP
ncbi:GNAT family N-acetyltransferase [Actinophytocola sp.]|uniref:GNAT family N-acetyltransferase n=1 Tax=Actinophytocola sp. TaxID=1872138 RepID=UPI002D80FC7D|nr:GNAT family N-acetyltransferase [Actinophytocola sp.]HET9141250.1 GNAT family N-acetyltransferase [Actinophytocola sp.]